MSHDTKEQEQINYLLMQADGYVRHEYLSVLDKASPIELDKTFLQKTSNDCMQLMHLERFTYNRQDDMAQKIRSVYGAIEFSGITGVLILDGRKDCIDLYLGVCGADEEKASFGYKAFLSSFNGVFPGCQYHKVKSVDRKALINDLTDPPMNVSVAAVSAFPFHGKDEKAELYGLDTLIDGMRNRPFTMILLAEAIERTELVQMRQGYESLYTQIAPLKKQDVSFSGSQTNTLGRNFSRSVADSLSVSSGISRGHTDTYGSSHSTQTGPDMGDQQKHQAVNQLLGSVAAAANVLTMSPQGLAVKAGANVLQSLFYGQTIANILNSGDTLVGRSSGADRKMETEGEHEDHSDSVTTQDNTTQGKTVTEGDGTSVSVGNTQSRTIQVSYINKSVDGLLERIHDRITEIMRLEEEGAFKFAAYFIAGDEETAVSAASLYRSVVTAGSGGAVNSPVYRWSRGEQTKTILASIRNGIHPAFLFEGHSEFPYVSAAQAIGLRDMPCYLCFPRHSVFGLNVAEHASFARDVLPRNGREAGIGRAVRIGCIYHMGREVKNTPVVLDRDTLASHLFVAGATGVGKSNFCYHLLDGLIEAGIKTMIIEPAKGEYAKVFGGRDGFAVYGTNLRQAPPLRINPFAFPKGITASEHIERLMAIFNSAWPLYSAMPAILKESLEEIYRKHGFNDIWGELPDGGSFPSFQDLLDVLPEIIGNSKYSAEVQGNYIGALVTRVKSLTNGVYSIIFSEDEIGDAGLFDENVIIDISRIGSAETQSLIMGILVTRLVEYRGCSGLMNSELKHVTLLEEAHHLLGRMGNVQSQDVGNMRGESVEMLSNAIREMRTYGEGFVIADQSPSVMDASVISNTQTKVFFMMPRREDRIIASDAASLDERQTAEAAKLPRGVAIILQNEWTDAVLCKVDHFAPDRYLPFCYSPDPEKETGLLLKTAVTILLEDRYGPEFISGCPLQEMDLSAAERAGFLLGGRKRKTVMEIIAHYRRTDRKEGFGLQKTADYLEELLGLEGLLKRNKGCSDMEEWSGAVRHDIMRKVPIPEDMVHWAISTYLLARSKKDRKYHMLYVANLTYQYDRKQYEEGEL